MNWKQILKHFNGWTGFAVSSILFFAAPPLYRYIDPTAGSFDAGYIHPIIYAGVVIGFAIGYAWLMVRLLAPGPFKAFDWFLESEKSNDSNDSLTMALWLFILFFVAIIAIVCAMV